MKGRKGCKEHAAEERWQRRWQRRWQEIACGRGRDDARFLEEEGLHLCT